MAPLLSQAVADQSRQHAKRAPIFRGSRPWAGLLNKVSGKCAPKKMQKRYIDLDEVNGLLQSHVACNVRDRFVGIKLQ